MHHAMCTSRRVHVEHVRARTRASPRTRAPPAQVKDAELNYGVLSQLLGHPKAELAHPNPHPNPNPSPSPRPQR